MQNKEQQLESERKVKFDRIQILNQQSFDVQQETKGTEREIERLREQLRQEKDAHQKKVQEIKRMIQIDRDRANIMQSEQNRNTEQLRSRLRAKVEAEKRKLRDILNINAQDEFNKRL